jgi:endonuclease YncB( thermonuclease family)
MRRFFVAARRAQARVVRSSQRLHRVPGTRMFIPARSLLLLGLLGLFVSVFVAIGAYRSSRPNALVQDESLGENRYTVLRVIDGDTFVVVYDGEPTRVRIFGIDSPEAGQAGYNEASDALRKLIDRKYVRLAFPKASKRDGFGRLLANVFVDGVDVGNEMIKSRHAVPFLKR